ncbi:hypothetical protein QL285_009731 [Trifolium repens]|nr:hypothetical protein QL285_009731 [Trifolium repens]
MFYCYFILPILFFGCFEIVLIWDLEFVKFGTEFGKEIGNEIEKEFAKDFEKEFGKEIGNAIGKKLKILNCSLSLNHKSDTDL